MLKGVSWLPKFWLVWCAGFGLWDLYAAAAYHDGIFLACGILFALLILYWAHVAKKEHEAWKVRQEVISTYLQNVNKSHPFVPVEEKGKEE